MPWREQYSVEVFLPVKAASVGAFEALKAELAAQHGGVTAYARAPAEGVWTQQGGETHDDIVILEVLVERLDEAAWTSLKRRLEAQLDEREILIRATPLRRLD